MQTQWRLVILFSLMLLQWTSQAQIGGNDLYEFLMLPNSARITALGDHVLTVKDEEVSFVYQNPALLNPQMHQHISFNQNFHLSGIAFGYAGYGHHVEKWNATWHTGIQYIQYGEFQRSDAFGNQEGTFKAAEYAWTIGIGKQLYEKLSVGVNTRFISSQLETYQSLGWSADVGATFQDTASRFTASLVIRHIGTPISYYTNARGDGLPTESQLAIAKRLRYLPLRVGVTYRYLNRWNILYDDPNNREPTSIFDNLNQPESGSPFVDNLARHFIFSGEFLFGKNENFRVRAAYNVLRAREMKVNELRSLGGFSFGFGMKVNRFRIDYGHSVYHLAGGNHHLSLSTSLREFK
ncbi:MAG: type IX secretion system protein PorQ [Bacteroidota bacterium]